MVRPSRPRPGRRAPSNAAARRTAARRAARDRRAEARRRTLDPDRVATVTLVVVAALALVTVGSGWWADAVLTGGAALGVAVDRHSPVVWEVDVPDGRLAVTALALMVVPVVLAVLGRAVTRRSTTGGVSRHSGVAAVLAITVAPAVALAYVASVHGDHESGWRIAAYVWPMVGFVVAYLGAEVVGSHVRPRQR